MTLPRLLSRYQDQLKAGLADVLQGEGLLYAILRYHIGLEDERGAAKNHTGKLLRPSLVLFTAEELGAKMEQALPAALALELIHNFSLIHDDVQDGDRTRRGRPTVWSRYGIAQAINSGDLLQALAVSQALVVGAKEAQALLQATAEMIEGQGLDLAFEDQAVGVASYLEMIDKKTGALIRCAFRLGAMVAGARAAVVDALVELGGELGRAFQIRDDLLGVWGEAKVTGKPQGSDIRSKKKSLPVAIVLSRASGPQRAFLEGIYKQKTLTDSDAKKIIEMMDRLNVREIAEDMVDEHLAQARACLAKVPFSKTGMEQLEELMDYLARREQ